ncbi:MAG: hypothetical protein ABJH98_11665 [Reichenbachiella sp.]|uniref:hypothetical protein n=1 Tax=Reichenbachiella sp. TaxID=2184521 RepID=UPI00329A68EC
MNKIFMQRRLNYSFLLVVLLKLLISGCEEVGVEPEIRFEVNTFPVLAIGSDAASSGGSIDISTGNNIDAKGVCWSTSPEPTIEDSKTEDGKGRDSFESILTDLKATTNYYVRAYAISGDKIEYGVQKKIFTPENTYLDAIVLKTQEEVDAFGAKGFVHIKGELSIGMSDELNSSIKSLESLKNLKSVYRLRIANNERLTSLNGLNNLISVDWGVILTNNDVLKNMEGLNNLTSANSLHIGGHGLLEDLSALKNLTNGELSVVIYGNKALSNLDGLEGLGGGEFTSIFIFDNPSLVNIKGLKNIKTAHTIEITNNVSLLNLEGFNNLEKVRGDVRILYDSALLDLNGLDNLKEIGRSLRIRYNPVLTNIIDLKNLTKIGDGNSSSSVGLDIFSNVELTTLDGLERLESVGNSISINCNHLLSDFCALQNIDFNSEAEGYFSTIENAYNPTVEDMEDGNCSM